MNKQVINNVNVKTSYDTVKSLEKVLYVLFSKSTGGPSKRNIMQYDTRLPFFYKFVAIVPVYQAKNIFQSAMIVVCAISYPYSPYSAKCIFL